MHCKTTPYCNIYSANSLIINIIIKVKIKEPILELILFISFPPFDKMLPRYLVSVRKAKLLE